MPPPGNRQEQLSANYQNRLAGASGRSAACDGLPPFGQRERLADHGLQLSRVGHISEPG
jgi:hypothetical protein